MRYPDDYDERDTQPYPQAAQARAAEDALADAESAWVLLIQTEDGD
jgi:hypothetical protein